MNVFDAPANAFDVNEMLTQQTQRRFEDDPIPEPTTFATADNIFNPRGPALEFIALVRDLEGELCDAILAHDYGRVRRLMDEGADIISTTTDTPTQSFPGPMTAWLFAVRVRAPESIIHLLRNNTPVAFGGPQ